MKAMGGDGGAYSSVICNHSTLGTIEDTLHLAHHYKRDGLGVHFLTDNFLAFF